MWLAACLVFAPALVLVSYGFHHRMTGGRLEIDPYRIALTASAVLLLAILAESLINPLWELLWGAKLWEYRIYPLHDRNVSALAILIWSAYGIHVYFSRQSLALRLPKRWSNTFGTSLVMGIEAPLLIEVSGNLVFLAIAKTYYAYYLPTDLGHLTSIQVIPVYTLCIFIGLRILHGLESLPRRAALPALLFAISITYLLAG